MHSHVIDGKYLTEMRQWVGEQVFGTLAAQASENLAPALAELTAAWRHCDTDAFHDAAHRLKGAAASIGCAALAGAAQELMQDPRPADAVSGAEMQALQYLLETSLQALQAFATQSQLTPVPAKPQ